MIIIISNNIISYNIIRSNNNIIVISIVKKCLTAIHLIQRTVRQISSSQISHRCISIYPSVLLKIVFGWHYLSFFFFFSRDPGVYIYPAIFNFHADMVGYVVSPLKPKTIHILYIEKREIPSDTYHSLTKPSWFICRQLLPAQILVD